MCDSVCEWCGVCVCVFIIILKATTLPHSLRILPCNTDGPGVIIGRCTEEVGALRLRIYRPGGRARQRKVRISLN